MPLAKKIPEILVLIIMLSLVGFSIAEALGMCALDIINIVPGEHKNIASIVDSEALSRPVLIGNAMIDGNIWGLSNYQGSFAGWLKIYTDSTGHVQLESELNISGIQLKPWQVIAYPEISYGVKPWVPNIVPRMSEYLKLPMEVSKLPRVLALIDYAVLNSSTAYNFAFDIWVLKGSTIRTPQEGDIEIMIWLHREGPGFVPNPAGKNIDSVKTWVQVDGVLRELRFDVWFQERIGNGWSYIAFVPSESKPRGEVGLDISFFIEKAFELLNRGRDDYYVFSIEIGFELFYNPYINFQASVHKYSLIITKNTGIEVLSTLTKRSSPIITWITPWGYPLNVKNHSGDFIPGVVVAYDVDCGLCTNYLQIWLKNSLNYIRIFREKNEVVFINLFPEKYYPSWRWRGELNTITLDERVISELKKVVGDGEGIYIGFSELTACLNDNNCSAQIVEAYRTLKREFPSARLYYYGSGGDNVEAIISLYKRAELDLVGLDIWDYEYKDGRVYIAEYLAGKLGDLNKLIPGYSLIIGEIGFRLNDREAYIEAWNKDRPVAYEKGAHIIYYKQVIEHIASLGIRPAYLGIWAWNDGAFAIQNDFEAQRAIIETLQTIGLAPIAVCEEQLEKAKQGWISEPIAIIIIIPTIAFITALLLMLRARGYLAKKPTA